MRVIFHVRTFDSDFVHNDMILERIMTRLGDALKPEMDVLTIGISYYDGAKQVDPPGVVG